MRTITSVWTSTYMQLAAHKQTTIRQIHEDYGLTGDD